MALTSVRRYVSVTLRKPQADTLPSVPPTSIVNVTARGYVSEHHAGVRGEKLTLASKQKK